LRGTSAVTSARVAEGVIPFRFLCADGDLLYWIETRANEDGRDAIVRRSADGQLTDITSPTANARTAVHEYGGAPMAAQAGIVFYSEKTDQRLWRVVAGVASPLTAASEPPGSVRYADGALAPDGRRLFCVRERHAAEIWNEIVAIDTTDGTVTVLASGHDFFAAPRPSPDGRSLAWLSWDHPSMPWSGTTLNLAGLGQDRLLDPRAIAGGASEAIAQPEWSADGRLHFVSDRSGWSELYRLRDDGSAEALTSFDGELTTPAWSFGLSSYAFFADGRIACAVLRRGVRSLAVLDPATGGLVDIDCPFNSAEYLRVVGQRIAAIAGSPFDPPAVVLIDPGDGSCEVVRPGMAAPFDRETIAVAEAITFPTIGGAQAHGFFYPPTGQRTGQRLPPLLVNCHGGPTSQAHAHLTPTIQFWTSHGFAYVDVNYGGSTGYGQEYRRRLDGAWGVIDVADAAAAARYLAGRGSVDAERVAIRGASAGGYATLRGLTETDAFAAGVCYFGLTDLEAFVRQTHKFESRYLDTLVGPLPEAVQRYRDRSPIHAIDRIRRPLLLFQGLEDTIVPPAQAEALVDALRSAGVPFAYRAFDGEGHGFRRSETIRRTLELELSFYGQVFGLKPGEQIEHLTLDGDGARGPKRAR